MRIRLSMFASFVVVLAVVVLSTQAASGQTIHVHETNGLDDVEHLVAMSGVTTNDTCVQDPHTICLANNRFRLNSTFTLNSQIGSAGAVRLTGDTGYFWFFGSSNVEAVVKVLDGCAVNNRFWVFAGGLTDQQTTLHITATLTGVSKQYTNPVGTKFAPIQDTDAFATCSAQPPCEFAIDPTSFSTGAGAANRTVSVTTQTNCNWTATSNASWITVTGGASGTGNGVVNLAIAPNPSQSPRTGTVTIAGRTFGVSQSGTAPPNPFDGSWHGLTSQGNPISFTIIGSAISTLSFGYHGTGSCTVDGDTTINFNPPRPLNGNSFSLSGSGVLAYNLNGTFTSSNTANGSVSFTFSNPFPPCTASGSASWNANK